MNLRTCRIAVMLLSLSFATSLVSADWGEDDWERDDDTEDGNEILGDYIWGERIKTHLYQFRKIFPVEDAFGGNYSAEQMIYECGGESEDATAWLQVGQGNGSTYVKIRVRKAPPYTLYTVWLRLQEPSPLTNRGVTALANPSDTEVLASVTPCGELEAAEALGIKLECDDGSGSDDVGSAELSNGFFTNWRGNGMLKLKLDFPLIKGAYQFQEFDPSLLNPIAIGDSPPFTLRLASHCIDQKGHGLIPGFGEPAAYHEMWFDWP